MHNFMHKITFSINYSKRQKLKPPKKVVLKQNFYKNKLILAIHLPLETPWRCSKTVNKSKTL